MNAINIKSRIVDNKINALNVLVEIQVQDYLEIAKEIMEENEYQRKKVKSSKTVYSLLRNDLKQGCTIPPIFLAVRKEAIGKDKTLIELQKISDENIKKYITDKKLIILDGLQRTLQMLELEANLIKEGDDENLKKFYKRILRLEIYVGINKIGILYRMLTLNTGQTPMSVRHQVEILYQDYLGKDKIGGIEILTEVQSLQGSSFGKYRFNELVDGFQSYLEKDELALDKSGLLEDIKSIEKLSKIGQQKDIFKEFVLTNHSLIDNILKLAKNWKFDKTTLKRDLSESFGPFGRNIEEIFIRSQVLTGFGAAIGILEDNEMIENLEEVRINIAKLVIGGDKEETFNNLINFLEDIRIKSKKIGNSQRRYFYHLFKSLFTKESDSFNNLNKSISKAYQTYKIEFM